MKEPEQTINYLRKKYYGEYT